MTQQIQSAKTWYIVCRTEELSNTPQPFTVVGCRLVAYRDARGQAIILQDRCPHRGVPLSKGVVKGDEIICRYHGWQFNSAGICTHIPELPDDLPIPPKATVTSYQTYEMSGFIWVNLGAETETYVEQLCDELDVSKIACTHNTALINADWQHMVENIIDGAHLAFVHGSSLDSSKNPFYSWSRNYRKKKVERKHYQISDTDYGFIAELKEGNKIFQFCIYLPSTVKIRMLFGNRKLIIYIHVVPIINGLARVEHIYCRSFLKSHLFDFIFKKIALKYLKEDVSIVECQQNTYMTEGSDWETSTVNDRLPNYFRKKLREYFSKLSEASHAV